MHEERFLTIEDLAKQTQLPKSWWYSQSRQKESNSLPVWKCGKYLRFKWDEVQNWLKDINREAN
jgi:hypothetical protein